MRRIAIKEYWGKRFALSEWDIVIVRVVNNDTYNKRKEQRPNMYSYLSHELMYAKYKEKFWDKWIVARINRVTIDSGIITARIEYVRKTRYTWNRANPLGWCSSWINDIHFDIIKIKDACSIHSATEYWECISNASAKEFGINDNDICTNDPDHKRKDIDNLKEKDILEKLERRRRIRAQLEVMQEVASNELTFTPTVN